MRFQYLVHSPCSSILNNRFKFRPGDPSTGLGNVHTAVNSLAWPSNYKLDKYDDEEKAAQSVPTAIEVEGDVFDFDEEISPVIKVIVDKTCEQALMEVEQETYMDHLAAARANFQTLEKKTLEDWKAQDEAEKARQAEMENAIKQARKYYKSEVKMQKRRQKPRPFSRP